MVNYLARVVRVSLGDPSLKMLFMSVNMAVIVRLICTCDENVKPAD